MRESAQLDKSIRSVVNAIELAYMLDMPLAGKGRRSHKRLSITMPVVVESLDESFQRLLCRHDTISRDIGPMGIGLVSMNPIPTDYVLLTLESCQGDQFKIVSRVTYCNESGYYFQVGCEFLELWDGNSFS